MKVFVVLLAVIAAAAAAGEFQPGLRVKFDQGTDIGGSFFFDIPKTVSAAQDAGWKQARRPRGPLPQLAMYCPSDKVLCALFDDTEYVAGLQIAINKAEFTENVFGWEARGFKTWNTAVNGQCKVFWITQQFFVDEEYLSKSKAERMAARVRDPERLLQAGAVWVSGFNGHLDRISIDENDIIEEEVFTEQSCLPWMGQHYYYNMTESTECTTEQMYTWFPMTRNGELIAMGFMTFGKLELHEDRRDWFERPAALVVQAIVPHAPSCLYEYATNPGALTMHIYFVEEPWTIVC